METTLAGYAVFRYYEVFKSYYVVWKQCKGTKSSDSAARLNRTMQYGNPSGSGTEEKEVYRLNRTMQYGNKLSENEEQ